MEAIAPENMTADELAEAFDDWMGDESYFPTLQVVADDAQAELDRIRLQDAASVLLWRIRKAQRELQRVEQLADAHRQRIDEFVEKRTAGPKYVIADTERQLEGIARQLIGEKETGLTVPNGRLTLRKPSTRLVVIDEAAALAHLKKGIAAGTLPEDVIRVKPEVAVSNLKAYANETPFSEPEDGKRTAPVVVGEKTAEAIPGVRFEQDAQRGFDYKLAK